MTAISYRSQAIDLILRENALSDLRQLEVLETDDEVIISGMVPSYYLKQMAQECVRPALAGRHLRNRIRVTMNG